MDPIHYWSDAPQMGALGINKQLPKRLSLPEDPHGNVWHYYRLLTMNPVIHGGKLVLMVRIPLIDLDSVMDLYKINNLSIYNHHIAKSLQYLLEGTYLVITKDSKYAATLSDMEFVKCTLADICVHLEYWPLPYWYKAMVCNCSVLREQWKN